MSDIGQVQERRTIVYAGSLGVGYDIKGLVEAAKLLSQERNSRFSFIVAGGGEKQEMIEEADRNGYLKYLGYIDRQQLQALYLRSSIGLLPYKENSMVAMPIKFFDYVNFGIFSISSLTLEVSAVLKLNEIGANYKAGDGRDLYEKIIEFSKKPLMQITAQAKCAKLAEHYSVRNQYSSFANFILS
jgi:hypothetical protein